MRPRPSFSLCLCLPICKLEGKQAQRALPAWVFAGSGFLSWFPPSLPRAGATPYLAPALPLCHLWRSASPPSAPRSQPQPWNHRREEHLRKTGSQGQCTGWGTKAVWRLRSRATREQLHSLTLQHKRIRSAPVHPWTDRPQRTKDF